MVLAAVPFQGFHQTFSKYGWYENEHPPQLRPSIELTTFLSRKGQNRDEDPNALVGGEVSQGLVTFEISGSDIART